MDISENLESSAPELHRLLGSLFPANSRNKQGNILHGLLYICENDPIQFSQNRSLLQDKFNAGTRQTLHNRLDTLEDLDLIIRENYQIQSTEEARQLIAGLRELGRVASESHQRRGITGERTPDTTFYNQVRVFLYTDGKTHAEYLWEWDIVNKSDTPIESQEHSVRSGGSAIEDLKLRHSDIIKDYSVEVDRQDFKEFTVDFHRPISPNSSIRYWYSYELPGNYKPGWGDSYRFRFNCRTYPVKSLNINIINDDRYTIPKKSLDSFVEIGDNPSEFDSSFRKRCRKLEMDSFSVLDLTAENITTGTVVEVEWDYSYQDS